MSYEVNVLGLGLSKWNKEPLRFFVARTFCGPAPPSSMDTNHRTTHL